MVSPIRLFGCENNSTRCFQVQVNELQKKFADRVLACQYTRRPEIPLERRTTDEYGKRVAQMLLLAGRSFWIETAIQIIKRKDQSGAVNPQFVLPWKNQAEVEWLVGHFTLREHRFCRKCKVARRHSEK